MTLIGANPYSYDVVRGVILLVAVSADAISAHIRGRRSPLIPELRNLRVVGRMQEEANGDQNAGQPCRGQPK